MEKEHIEAQSRLDAIKRVLVDSDKTAPVPAGMLYAIGLTLIFLDLAMDMIFSLSTVTFNAKLATSFVLLLIASMLAIVVSKVFTHKENDKLDRIFSKNQRFIFTIYAISMIVGTAITMGVVVMGGWALVHFYWAIILGAAAHVFGFFTKKALSRFGLFLVLSSVVQISGAIIYVKSIVPSSCEAGAEILPVLENVYHFGMISSIVFVGLGHILMGYLLGKNENV